MLKSNITYNRYKSIIKMILVVITLKIDITYNETESISEGASVVITLKINITYNLEGQTQVEHML